jgi:hypothetical protein
MNFLAKTAESEVKQDKNGKNYKRVTFTEVVIMQTPFGPVQKPISQSRSNTQNRFEESYLDQKVETGYADPIFNPKNPSNGGIFQGAIESRNVEEYEIVDTKTGEEKAVDKYTTIVFGDTDSPTYESLVKSAFKSQGHEVIEAAKLTIAPLVAEPAF